MPRGAARYRTATSLATGCEWRGRLAARPIGRVALGRRLGRSRCSGTDGVTLSAERRGRDGCCGYKGRREDTGERVDGGDG